MANLNVHIEGGQAFWGNLYFSPHDRLEFSYNFVIGIRWILFAENDISSKSISVLLFPESEDPPPLVRASLLVAFPLQNVSSTVHEGLLRTRDDCSVTLDFPPGCCQFDVVVEFSEIKISDSDGGEDVPVFPIDERPVSASTRGIHRCFSRMLKESLLTDITINTDGCGTPRSQSRSFRKIPRLPQYVHARPQGEAVVDSRHGGHDIRVVHGPPQLHVRNDKQGRFLEAPAGTAGKYSMPDLKDACEESLLEDINLDNVLERGVWKRLASTS